MIHVGFTGTREGMSEEQRDLIYNFLFTLQAAGLAGWAHHGLCVGADAQFHKMAKYLHIPIVGHPPSNTRFKEDIPDSDFEYMLKPDGYLARNDCIVDSSTALLATPKSRELVGGTGYTIRKAIEKEIGCVVVYPDGSTNAPIRP